MASSQHHGAAKERFDNDTPAGDQAYFLIKFLPFQNTAEVVGRHGGPGIHAAESLDAQSIQGIAEEIAEGDIEKDGKPVGIGDDDGVARALYRGLHPQEIHMLASALGDILQHELVGGLAIINDGVKIKRSVSWMVPSLRCMKRGSPRRDACGSRSS